MQGLQLETVYATNSRAIARVAKVTEGGLFLKLHSGPSRESGAPHLDS